MKTQYRIVHDTLNNVYYVESRRWWWERWERSPRQAHSLDDARTLIKLSKAMSHPDRFKVVG